VSEQPSEPYADDAAREHASELGIWAFLASELMFFGPPLAAYLENRVAHAAAFAAASRHTDFLAGTANTFLLLTSSLFIALGMERFGRNSRRAMHWWWAAAALGVTFLAVKAYEYTHDWQEHLVPGVNFDFEAAHRNAAEIFFYLYFALTGVHALHLAVGITLVATVAVRVSRGVRDQHAFAEGVGRYWHFVDIVWVFIYPLLYLVGRFG
jgi:cytochrome c oxidase subunit 3